MRVEVIADLLGRRITVAFHAVFQQGADKGGLAVGGEPAPGEAAVGEVLEFPLNKMFSGKCSDARVPRLDDGKSVSGLVIIDVYDRLLRLCEDLGDSIIHHAGDEPIVLAQLIGILQLRGINKKGVESPGFSSQFRNATAKTTPEFAGDFDDKADFWWLNGVHVANYSTKGVFVAKIPLDIAKCTIESR